MVCAWMGKGSMMPLAGEGVDHVLVDAEFCESQEDVPVGRVLMISGETRPLRPRGFRADVTARTGAVAPLHGGPESSVPAANMLRR